MVKDDESVLDQFERSESFELVSPLSVSVVNGTITAVRMLSGSILQDMTRGSQRRKLTLSAHLNSRIKARATSRDQAQRRDF